MLFFRKYNGATALLVFAFGYYWLHHLLYTTTWRLWMHAVPVDLLDRYTWLLHLLLLCLYAMLAVLCVGIFKQGVMSAGKRYRIGVSMMLFAVLLRFERLINYFDFGYLLVFVIVDVLPVVLFLYLSHPYRQRDALHLDG